MKKYIVYLLTVIFILLAALPAAAIENTKVGIVDLNKVVVNSIAVKKANEELAKMVQQKNSQLEAKAKSIEDLKKETLSKTKEAKLALAVKEFNTMTIAAQSEVNKKLNELNSKISSQITGVVNEIAKEENFTLIVSSSSILFSNTKTIDLTDKVLKKYDAVYTKK